MWVSFLWRFWLLSFVQTFWKLCLQINKYWTLAIHRLNSYYTFYTTCTNPKRTIVSVRYSFLVKIFLCVHVRTSVNWESYHPQPSNLITQHQHLIQFLHGVHFHLIPPQHNIHLWNIMIIIFKACITFPVYGWRYPALNQSFIWPSLKLGYCDVVNISKYDTCGMKKVR